MKIFNVKSTLNTTPNYKKTNFKANPAIQKQLVKMTKGEGRKAFQLLAGTLGLSSIISWANTLKNEDSQKVNESLNRINTKLDDEWKAIVIKDVGNSLDIISEVDNAENVILTRALCSDVEPEKNIRTIANEEKELLLDEKTFDKFLNISADKLLKTIWKYLETFSSVAESVRKDSIKALENKLFSLIKQANQLKESEATAELYSKLANMVKVFTLTNLYQEPELEEVEQVQIESSQVEEISSEEQAETPRAEAETIAEEVEVEAQNTDVTDSAAESVREDSQRKRLQKNDEEIEISQGFSVQDQAAGAFNIKPLGKIEIKDDGKSRFPSKKESTSEVTTKPKKISVKLPKKVDTEKEQELFREAVNEVITNYRKVDPSVYKEDFDIIEKIYNDLGNKVGTRFIEDLATSDRSATLKKYKEFTKGNLSKLNFRNFMFLAEMNLFYKGSITQEDFDLLDKYHNESIDFIKANTPKGEKHNIEIKFKPDARVSIEERLKIMHDVYKIAFNVNEEEMIKPYEEIDKVEKENVIQELVFRMTHLTEETEEDAVFNHGYKNIMQYLGLNDNDIADVIEVVASRGYKTAEVLLLERIENRRSKTKLNNLCSLLNTQNLDKYMKTCHARMRFLERFVLKEDNLADNVKDLKNATTVALNTLETKILSQLKSKVISYFQVKKDENGNFIERKTTPQLMVGVTLISLNSNGIQTIF